MKFIIIVSLIVVTVLAKEKVIYEAKGAQLVDLIRGIPPEGGALKLTKVEGDKDNLPDGVYFQPEDEALEDAGESGYLYLNVSSIKIWSITKSYDDLVFYN